jgi:hypothetical protein
MSEIEKKEDLQHLETALPAINHHDEHKDANLVSAMAAEQEDLNQTVWQAVKANRWAVFWSIMVSMTVVSCSPESKCRAILTNRLWSRTTCV